MKVKMSLGAALAAGVVVVAGCGSSSGGSAGSGGGSSGGGTLSVGFIDSLTGESAFIGTEQQKAVTLAVQRWNASHAKPKFKLVTKDDQSTPAGAVSGMEQLIANKSLVGFVGQDETNIGDGLIPMLHNDKRPMIMLQVTQLPKRVPNVFTTSPSTAVAAQKVADYAYSHIKVKKVALITQVQPTLEIARTTFKSEAQKHGVQVTADQQAAESATSFGPQVTTALSGHPAAIGISALGPQAGTLVSDLRSAGFKGLIFAQQAADSAATVKTSGKSIDGTLVGTYWDAAASSGRAVAHAWKKAYASQPPIDVFGMEAYDAANMMMTAAATGARDQALVNDIAHKPFAGDLEPTLRFASDGFLQLSGYVVQMNTTGNKILK